MADTIMALDETGTVQAMPEPQVIWYCGENAGQDVLIRLVRRSDDNRTLATLMAHSSRLVTCSRYFAALLSHRRESEPTTNLEEVTLQIDDDLGLYTDCFFRMYTPSYVDFKSVTCSLELLRVATQLGLDDVMRSICLWLSSSLWSKEDEMWIRIAASMEDFSRDHAQDLFERLEGRLTRDDLRPFIARCMELGMKCTRLRSSSFPSMESATQAKEILSHILTAARGQARSSTPTPEQEVMCVINEEFKLLLEAANVKVEAAHTMEDNPGLMATLDTVKQLLDIFLGTRMADEAVKWFAKYTSFPKLIEDAVTSELSERNGADVLLVVEAFIWTVMTMVSDLVKSGLRKRNVHVDDSVRDALLLNWLPLLNWLHINVDEVLGGMSMEFREVYGQVKKDLLFMWSSSQELNEIMDKVLAP